MSFAYPLILLALLILPLLVYRQYFQRNKRPPVVVRLSSLAGLPRRHVPLRVRMRRLLPALRLLALALLIIALARPRKLFGVLRNEVEGIDIVLSMDLSRSMEKKDFKPNRLEAARKVALDFVDLRPTDRLGLVVFSGESFTQCPLTTDHELLKNTIREVQYGLLQDGTAIGMGLATAVDRLRDSKAKSKVVILLTDGANNSGTIDPMTAAEIATRYGVKVYTIGMASVSGARLPYPVAGDVEIDEELMQNIAQKTGGKYFRATDNNKLQQIYAEIDRLEKTKIENNLLIRSQERYHIWLLLACLILALELGLRHTYLKSLT